MPYNRMIEWPEYHCLTNCYGFWTVFVQNTKGETDRKTGFQKRHTAAMYAKRTADRLGVRMDAEVFGANGITKLNQGTDDGK